MTKVEATTKASTRELPGVQIRLGHIPWARLWQWFHWEITRSRNIWAGVTPFIVVRVGFAVIYSKIMTRGSKVFLAQSPYPRFMADIPQELMRAGDVLYVGVLEWWHPVLCMVVTSEAYKIFLFVWAGIITVAGIYKILIENTEHDPHYKGEPCGY